MAKVYTNCPVEYTASILSNKWKCLILRDLIEGTKRFNELNKSIIGISAKVLTENLKELEDLGIIQRTSYEGNTLHVEYCLTHLGDTLQPIFQELIMWGLNYSQERRKPSQT